MGKKAKKAKKPKKKKKKKAKKKKKKKRKKAKKKKVKYVGGKRRKGQHKSKGHIAGGKIVAKIHKAKGIGLFKPKTCSAALTAITGKSKMTYGQIVKSVWAYIKAKKLNKGRIITPDATLGKIIPGKIIMFKLATHVF